LVLNSYLVALDVSLVCLFVFISGTMRFSRYGLGASSPPPEGLLGANAPAIIKSFVFLVLEQKVQLLGSWKALSGLVFN